MNVYPCTRTTLRTTLGLAVGLLLSHSVQAVDTTSMFRPNPDKPIPHVGMATAALKLSFGQPAITQQSLAGSGMELWDYGTFRTFIRDGLVHRSELW